MDIKNIVEPCLCHECYKLVDGTCSRCYGSGFQITHTDEAELFVGAVKAIIREMIYYGDLT